MPDSESDKSLVIVAGAGASNEASLPTGAELKRNIAAALDIRYKLGMEKVSGDDLIDGALRILTRNQGRPQDLNEYLKSSWLIRDAMPQAQSIDNFIDSHKKDTRIAQCGKLAIARCILAAEASSLMKVDRSNINNKIDFRRREATWFNALFQLIVENCGHEELPARLGKLAVVSFNYDRCIEHFLHSSLQNYYGISQERAAELMLNLNFYHPYGVAGLLPWMNGTSSIDFGATPYPQQLLELSNSLRTFTEGTDETASDIIKIRSVLRTAKRVVFLGFAFHPLNLELLYGGSSKPDGAGIRAVYATAWGLSDSDSNAIRIELVNKGGHIPTQIALRNDLTSAKLFREYWRSLSLI